MNISIIVKKMLSALLYHHLIISKICNNNKSIILGYHHILPDDDQRISFLEPSMYVTESTFRMHIQFLKKYYEIVPLYTISENINVRNKCVITFDDGWEDNYSYAYPIIKEFNIPATIFLSTNFINTISWPWPDRLSYYIHNASIEEINEICSIGEIKISRKTRGINDKLKRSIIIVNKLIKTMKRKEHNQIIKNMKKIDALMIAYKEQMSNYRSWLKWNQINEMKKNKISFGAHSHNHVILTGVDQNTMRREIILSKEALMHNIKDQIYEFSYPNGDYDGYVIKAVKENGFKVAVTTESGSIDASNNVFTLRRYLIHNDISQSASMFACKIMNIF